MRWRLLAGRSKGLGIAVGTGLALAGGLAAYAGTAAATPQPSLSQVKAEVNSLQAKADATGQQYDQATGQLSAARSQLAQVQHAVTAAQTRFTTARAMIAQLAAAAYEDSGEDSIGSLLTTNDPATVLNQGSLLVQQLGGRQAQVTQFLADAQSLTQAQQRAQRTEDGVASLAAQLDARKTSLNKLLSAKQATLDSLTEQQQAAVAASTVGGNTGNTGTTGSTGSTGTTSTYNGPTSTQAEKAVAFAFGQLGKPYQWGATGPYAYDCSGLVQAAWASAGVSIPRDTYEQWAALPHVPTSSLEPGDLLYFDGIGHVAIYVGNGNIIDAPQTGEVIRELPLSTGWYSGSLVGAARP
jgi:cell wall-associated NlpC family hydrolase